MLQRVDSGGPNRRSLRDTHRRSDPQIFDDIPRVESITIPDRKASSFATPARQTSSVHVASTSAISSSRPKAPALRPGGPPVSKELSERPPVPNLRPPPSQSALRPLTPKSARNSIVVPCPSAPRPQDSPRTFRPLSDPRQTPPRQSQPRQSPPRRIAKSPGAFSPPSPNLRPPAPSRTPDAPLVRPVTSGPIEEKLQSGAESVGAWEARSIRTPIHHGVSRLYAENIGFYSTTISTPDRRVQTSNPRPPPMLLYVKHEERDLSHCDPVLCAVWPEA